MLPKPLRDFQDGTVVLTIVGLMGIARGCARDPKGKFMVRIEIPGKARLCGERPIEGHRLWVPAVHCKPITLPLNDPRYN